MPQPLHLDVDGFTPTNWRWTLSDHAGAYIQHHEAKLNPADACYEALLDLPGYLRVHASPDKRQQDEQRLIAAVGDYIGGQVLGDAIGRKLRKLARPSVVVRVRVPTSAQFLLTLPLEIARVDGAPLTGISFVFQAKDETPPDIEPIGARLRLLALFSVPPDGNALNLRRERQMLRTLVEQLAGAASRAIDLRVLQYGVTRKSLKEVLEEGEGWDIIHFSGHGLPGALVLEKPDGTADHVSSHDLAAMLAQAGARVKLVMLSACLSAAASIEQSLRWLGLDPETAPARDAPASASAQAAPTVAQALTQSLGCAVVAMRYAVEDEFASDFGRALYEQLFEKGNALPQAAWLALSRTAGPAGALSAAAASLFGARAADLKLDPPGGEGFDPNPGLAYVPGPPPYFVGRVAAMTRASAALALDSKKSGVLFHGMAGGGKTSCALELIHHHASIRRFKRFVWFQAPEPGKDIEPALRNFALAMERDLPGLKMVQVVSNADELTAWLPRLTKTLSHHATLITLDNVESLLNDKGQWLDPRWGALVRALLTPGGLSRLVLTSRVVPADLPASTEVIAVHALARDEALLLAREMPNLRRLLDGTAEGISSGDQRALVRQVLRQAQGHPKLLDFAEQLAADPAKLQAEIGKLDATNPVPAAKLDAFLEEGASKLDIAAFLESLRTWTEGIAATLPEPARLAFQFLCAMEENDRQGWIIAGNWDDVWRALGNTEPVPDFVVSLEMLVRVGLVERRGTSSDPNEYAVAIHPGVAEAGRIAADAALQAIVDREIAATWVEVMRRGKEVEGKAPTGLLILRAGMAAFPYLARLGEWNIASAMLEQSVSVDKSPETIAAALPMARRIAEATAGSERADVDSALLAGVLVEAGHEGEAEALLRKAAERAAKRGDFGLASAVLSDLVSLLRGTGRFADALVVVDQRADLSRRADRGPWSQLSIEGQRLQILNELGHSDEVLQEYARLSVQIRSFPDPPDANDNTIAVWNVREALLDTGRSAAMRLQRWQMALDLTDEIVRLEEARGAPALERAKSRFNATNCLIRLGRLSEARSVLEDCISTFRSEGAIRLMASAYSVLADLEDELGRHQEALRLEEISFRYQYLSNDPGAVVVSHANYAVYLTRTNAQPRLIVAHHLAATLLQAATNSGKFAASLDRLGTLLRLLGPSAADALPDDIAVLRSTVQQIEGVKFGEMLRRFIENDAEATERLRSIIAEAQKAPQ